ncbi:MAG TPA: hypothetical protein VHT91_16025 [Kofleriaceae bacterium]|jgi:hypothetical protein|nr:hypothetical protein [Kofleriaceae bacterium]
MKTIYHALFLSPLLFALGCAVPDGSAQDPTSETDDSLSASDSLTTAAATEGGHACNVVATDNVTEGVHCANWAFVRQNATQFQIWGVGESLCQPKGGGTEERCTGIQQNVNINVNDQEQAGQGHVCGVLGGSACPGGTVRFSNTSGHKLVTIPVGGCVTIQAALINDAFVFSTSSNLEWFGANVFSLPRSLCNN